MERAIQNILVNAIRYSPSGELIRISLSEIYGTIRGEIENTGVHVSDDAIPHLFEAFYRADASRNRMQAADRQLHLKSIIHANYIQVALLYYSCPQGQL